MRRIQKDICKYCGGDFTKQDHKDYYIITRRVGGLRIEAPYHNGCFLEFAGDDFELEIVQDHEVYALITGSCKRCDKEVIKNIPLNLWECPNHCTQFSEEWKRMIKEHMKLEKKKS